MLKNLNMLLFLVILSLAVFGTTTSSYPADWGYEDEAIQHKACSANKSHNLCLLAKQESISKQLTLACNYWLDLFSQIKPQGLLEVEKARIKNYFRKKAETKRNEVVAILNFWPQLTSFLKAHPELKEHYRALLYALLRVQETMSSTTVTDKQVSQDAALIAEILGPARIALTGIPPLTEDAVNAYTEMACFLYEQQNPNKTIDAMDNRLLFAQFITDKFKAAKSSKDRAAMANFNFSWTKFKIIWAQADGHLREVLLNNFRKPIAILNTTVPSPSSSANHLDPMLSHLLKYWPWQQFL